MFGLILSFLVLQMSGEGNISPEDYIQAFIYGRLQKIEKTSGKGYDFVKAKVKEAYEDYFVIEGLENPEGITCKITPTTKIILLRFPNLITAMGTKRDLLDFENVGMNLNLNKAKEKSNPSSRLFIPVKKPEKGNTVYIIAKIKETSEGELEIYDIKEVYIIENLK